MQIKRVITDRNIGRCATLYCVIRIEWFVYKDFWKVTINGGTYELWILLQLLVIMLRVIKLKSKAENERE